MIDICKVNRRSLHAFYRRIAEGLWKCHWSLWKCHWPWHSTIQVLLFILDERGWGYYYFKSLEYDMFLPIASFENTLQWHHNGCDCVSNHQPHDCLLNLLFRRRSKKTSKLRVTGLCAWNSLVTSPHKGPVTRKMFPFDDVIMKSSLLLSGVPDYFGRNKISSGGDLSHYSSASCIRVFFYFVWFVFINHIFQFYYELCTYCNILDIYLS